MRRIVFLLVLTLAAGFLMTCDRSEMFDFATVGPPASTIYLFSSGPPLTGGMGGPQGADYACRRALTSTYPWLRLSVARAFISSELSPIRLTVPAAFWASPVIGVKSNGTMNLLAMTWGELWNGAIPLAISSVTDATGLWWSGSTVDGMTDTTATCGSWADELAPAGMTGDTVSTTVAWVNNTTAACNVPYYLLCVGW